jgi:hypothetical protein
MKKIFAILVLPVMFASGINVSIDRHYCGGQLVDTKLSITSKLASCGMEVNETNCSNVPSVGEKCCEDQLSYYGIYNKFVPEFFNLTIPFEGKDIPTFPGYFAAFNNPDINNSPSWVLPPGVKLKPGIALSEICVYRI